MFDGNLDRCLEFLSSKLKTLNLFDWILDPFKGRNMYVVCDLVYMGDSLAECGCVEWKTNVIGTCQNNCTGLYFFLKAIMNN